MKEKARVPAQPDISKVLRCDFDAAVERTAAALKKEGFGPVLDLDVRETVRRELGVEGDAYRILGSLEPPLPWAEMADHPEMSLLPCNVTIRREGKDVRISAVRPTNFLKFLPRSKPLAAAAERVEARIQRAIRSV